MTDPIALDEKIKDLTKDNFLLESLLAQRKVLVSTYAERIENGYDCDDAYTAIDQTDKLIMDICQLLFKK